MLTGNFITTSSNVPCLFFLKRKMFPPFSLVMLVRNNDSPMIERRDLFSSLRSICPGGSGQFWLRALQKMSQGFQWKRLCQSVQKRCRQKLEKPVKCKAFWASANTKKEMQLQSALCLHANTIKMIDPTIKRVSPLDFWSAKYM